MIGTLTEPAVAFTVPCAETAFDQTGKFISVRSLTSRTPASMTKPTTPCARADSARSSPNIPSVDSEVVDTTRMSPFWQNSIEAWIIRLSPGWQEIVIAVPAAFAAGYIGRIYGLISPVRACAACTVATPRSPNVLTISDSARTNFRTTVGFISHRSFQVIDITDAGARW